MGARRYVFGHEERGLLVVSKKPPTQSKPFWHKDNTCFPLADCRSITADQVKGHDHCIAITCNHEKLVLQAADAAECSKWVEGLHRMRSCGRVQGQRQAQELSPIY